ncbi:MFS domain-containing protein [Aphelenchoides besseyi]|nr:MFS domain-containing protein [Aphelenchoides besseyi]
MNPETTNGNAVDRAKIDDNEHLDLAVEDENAQDDYLEERLKTAGLIEPPDGGYGWVVLFCSFCSNLIVDAIIFTAPERLLPMWETSFATKKLFACLHLLVAHRKLPFRPFASVLANTYGCNRVAMLGSILAACGFLLSAIVQEQLILCFTFGIVGGAGLGLVFLAAVVSVSEYFNKKRAFATGIAVCGSGIGTAGLSTLNPIIIRQLRNDWRLYCVFLCCFSALAFIFGYFFKPLKPSKAQLEELAKLTEDYIGRNEDLGNHLSTDNGLTRAEYTSSPHIPLGELPIERFPQSNGGGLSGSRHLAANRPFLSTIELHASRYGDKNHMSQQDLAKYASKASLTQLNRPFSKIDVFYPGSIKNLSGATNAVKTETHGRTKSGCDIYLSTIGLPTEQDYIHQDHHTWYYGCLKQLKTLLDVSLLKSPSFLVLALGGFLTLICFFVPFMFVAQLAQSKGVDEVKSKYLVTAMGLINIFARVLCGWISDHPRVDPLVMSNVAVISGGIATMALPLFDNFLAFAIYCIPFASGVASFAALRSVICANLLGMERLTNAYGFLMLFMGIAALIGPPFASFLKNKTDGFGLAFCVMGGFMTLSGLISLPLRRINEWERKRDEKSATSAVELQPLNAKTA